MAKDLEPIPMGSFYAIRELIMDWASIVSSVIQSVLVALLVAFAPKIIKEIKNIASIKPTLASLSSSLTNVSDKLDGLTKRVDDESKQREAHDRLDDSAAVFSMRDHLLTEHDRIVTKGWADYSERASWHNAYAIYETLVAASGQTNGVMGDYAEDIDELPTGKPAA
jgi:hypothetical protein